MMGFCKGSSVGTYLLDFSAAFLQQKNMASKLRKMLSMFVKMLLTLG